MQIGSNLRHILVICLSAFVPRDCEPMEIIRCNIPAEFNDIVRMLNSPLWCKLRPKLTNTSRIARFGSFELDMQVGELRHNGGQPVALPEQPFRILSMLLENPQNLVTRDEIRAALWSNGTSVEFEHSISAAMNRLRRALNDNAEDPCFVDTIARRGY